MITLIILFIVCMLVEKIYKPRLDYIESVGQRPLLILFYGAKNTRKRKIFKL